MTKEREIYNLEVQLWIGKSSESKKIKLSEDKLLNKSDSKANSDLEDAIDEEIE